MVDGASVAEAVADAGGKFAAFLDLGPSDVPRIITLSSATDDGATVASGATVMLEPTPAPPVEVATADLVAEPENATEAASRTRAPPPRLRSPPPMLRPRMPPMFLWPMPKA